MQSPPPAIATARSASTPAGKVQRDRLVGGKERLVSGVDAAGEAGQLAQQLGAGVGDHPLAIGGDLDPGETAATLHLESALP